MPHVSNRMLDHILAGVGLVVALPAIYFFTGSFLKYELNLLPNFDIFIPPPIVMVGGLLLAIVLNMFPLLWIQPMRGQKSPAMRLVTLKPWNTAIVGIAGVFLALLLGYVLVENLAEHHASVINFPSHRNSIA